MTDITQKRMLICSTNYLPHVGGAELAVKEIAQRLVTQGFTFDLITARLETNLPYYEFIDGVHVHRVGFGFWLDKFLLPVLGLLKYMSLRRRPYDVVWSLMASQGSVLASFVSFVSKSKLLLTLQEGDDELHLARYTGGVGFLYKLFIKPWHTLVFKRATRITVISQYLKARAEKYSLAPVDVVPNGVHVSHFAHVNQDEVKRLRDIYNISDKKVVVSVSRLVKKNNIELLIKSLVHLEQNIVLLLVGDGEEKQKLEELSRTLNVEERVIFVGNVLPVLVPNYLHIGNVFARVSLSEGLGNAFLESFAAGVPVVASPVGGIVDFVEHGETGLLVDPHDVSACADAVMQLLTDNELRQHIIDQGRVRAQKYSWDSIAEQMKYSFDQM